MIRHILKNGQEVKDLKGHIVKKEEVPRAYHILKERKKQNEKST